MSWALCQQPCSHQENLEQQQQFARDLFPVQGRCCRGQKSQVEAKELNNVDLKSPQRHKFALLHCVRVLPICRF